MDRLAEKIADILGSAPIIILFALWLGYHNLSAWDYTNFIAEKVQSGRMEKAVKKDLRKSDKVINKLD